MRRYLTATEVASLAVKTAKKLSICIPDEEDLSASLMQRNNLPKIYRNSSARLWVDNLYIAFSREDSDRVHYVYLADKHIIEELKSYKNAVNKNASLPPDIKRQFSQANREMLKTAHHYHIFQKSVVK